MDTHSLNRLYYYRDRHHLVRLDLAGWHVDHARQDFRNLLPRLVSVEGLKRFADLFDRDLTAVLFVLYRG